MNKLGLGFPGRWKLLAMSQIDWQLRYCRRCGHRPPISWMCLCENEHQAEKDGTNGDSCKGNHNVDWQIRDHDTELLLDGADTKQ